jgi:hypothetical protein
VTLSFKDLSHHRGTEKKRKLCEAVFDGGFVKPTRSAQKLSDSFRRQLNMYALAASAAGVGISAMAQPAEARIVYTKTHRVMGPNSRLSLNFTDHHQFRFTDYIVGSGFLVAAFSIAGRYSHAFPLATQSCRFAAALAAGKTVSSKQFPPCNDWRGIPMATAEVKSSTSHYGGPWVNVTNRYLGLSFGRGAARHYGWARLNVQVDKQNAEIHAVLTGYAYETLPNKPIITGKTKGPDAITVGSGSLGALAAGAPGLHR